MYSFEEVAFKNTRRLKVDRDSKYKQKWLLYKKWYGRDNTMDLNRPGRSIPAEFRETEDSNYGELCNYKYELDRTPHNYLPFRDNYLNLGQLACGCHYGFRPSGKPKRNRCLDRNKKTKTKALNNPNNFM